MQKLFLIDGNAIIHRAYHAFPHFKTSKGETVNAVYGFSMMLLNILNTQKPDYLAVSFDRRAKTFRHEQYAEYKATRVKAPDELYEQIPRIREVVDALGVPVYELDGFEADDVLGALATQAGKINSSEIVPKEGASPQSLSPLPPLHTFIVTGDMDTLQLVNDRTSIFTPNGGFKDAVIYTPAKVKEKYGLSPAQMIDYKSIRGDTSDNIKGIQGIGEKGATTLLQKYQTLDGIYEHLSEINGALHDKLEKGKEEAYFSKGLVTLRLDAPVTLDLRACATDKLNKEKCGKLFEDLEFRSLLPKLQLPNQADDDIPTLSSTLPASSTQEAPAHSAHHNTAPKKDTSQQSLF